MQIKLTFKLKIWIHCRTGQNPFLFPVSFSLPVLVTLFTTKQQHCGFKYSVLWGIL